MTTNLNFIREIETKNIIENCHTMTPQDILDYLYKYENMDSCYIYENLPDNVQKELDNLIVQKLLEDYQKIKEKKESIIKLNKRVQVLDDEMENFESMCSDYRKLLHVSGSLHNLRSETYEELADLQTYSKFGPYEIDSIGKVQFDDNFDKIEIYLLILKQRFRKLKNEVPSNDDDCLKIKEIIDHRMKIDNLEMEIKNINDAIQTLKQKMKESRETEWHDESAKLTKQFIHEMKKNYELRDKLNELKNNYPKLGKERIEIILHDFESLKNRMRKMKNYYPWSSTQNNPEETSKFNDIKTEIDQLQKVLESWK